MEILEKLGVLQSKIKGTEVGATGHKSSSQQLQDDVGVCLLKLGRFVDVSSHLRIIPECNFVA
jgi:hypothetical protein